MYLKSLEMQGFKSFPDKVTLTFDKGITAVVGPNGSGKSNIGDAVRWVLGEQSTKTLRGSKMEDVIFSGTQKRKQTGFAKVTLNIDNSDGTIEDAPEQISVTRRYYRSGESEYILNGKKVRLKDVNELFMDTGLGRDGYSIIGQGRIAEIVGAKSDERRAIFEEAAGVSKFRYRKEDAQRKLAAADENLVRITDIAAELEGRLEPLRKQAEKAKEYLELAAKRKNIEVSLWNMQLDVLKDKKLTFDDELLKKSQELENLENEISEQEQKVESSYRILQKNDVDQEETRRKIRETQDEIAHLESDKALAENDIKHREEESLRLKGQLDSEEEDIKNLAKRKEERKQKFAEIEKSKKQLKSEKEKYEKALADVSQRITEITEKSQQSGKELANLYAEQSDINAKYETVKSKIADYDNDDSLDEIKKTESEYKTHAKDLETCQKAIDDIEQKIAETDKSIAAKEAELKKLGESLETKQLSFGKLQAEMQSERQRMHILSDMERNMEGFAGSVRAVMKAAEKGYIRGVYGTVAGLLTVPTKYGTAIETALGGSMQNIIVDNENAAKAGIAYLKQNRAGRATFLPLTSVHGKSIEDRYDLSREAGFEGFAWRLVSFNPKYEGIVKSLLGRAAVFDNIDNATNAARKFRFAFRIVTLDGQIINAGGSFTGGSAQRSGGMLTRHSEIENISEKLRNNEKILADRQRDIDYIKKNNDIKKEALEEEKALRIWQDNEKVRIGTKKEQTELVTQSVKNRLDNLKEKYAGREEVHKADLENCKIYRKKLDEISKKTQANIKQSGTDREKLAGLENKRNEITNKNSEIAIKIAGVEKDGQALENEAENDRQLEKSRREHHEAIIQKTEENTRVSAELKERAETDAKEAESKRSQSVELDKRLVELRQKHDAQDALVRRIQDGMKEQTAAREKLAAEKERIDERIKSTSAEYDKIISRLLEDYELTRSMARDIAEPVENEQETRKNLSEIKGKIKKLGSVNVDSVDEYRNVSERYEFMSKQIKDIRSSKKELEDLIVTLTAQMSKTFAESFEIIRNNFRQIFPELFGGGKGDLELTDPDHVLDSGIEIKVQPPGKKIKNLISLSGGEQSFVAVAIYFSILKLRPSPFCILDETDAALDEANVRKYAQYLHNFTDTTQFILITHRRSAMEEAGVLYGVTMQEDGISKLLKLDQREALETAENN